MKQFKHTQQVSYRFCHSQLANAGCGVRVCKKDASIAIYVNDDEYQVEIGW